MGSKCVHTVILERTEPCGSLKLFRSLDIWSEIYYNLLMRNWSTDTSKFNKNSCEFKIWKLEQLINFGLHGDLIDTVELRTFLPSLTIDLSKRKFLQLLLKDA